MEIPTDHQPVIGQMSLLEQLDNLVDCVSPLKEFGARMEILELLTEQMAKWVMMNTLPDPREAVPWKRRKNIPMPRILEDAAGQVYAAVSCGQCTRLLYLTIADLRHLFRVRLRLRRRARRRARDRARPFFHGHCRLANWWLLLPRLLPHDGSTQDTLVCSASRRSLFDDRDLLSFRCRTSLSKDALSLPPQRGVCSVQTEIVPRCLCLRQSSHRLRKPTGRILTCSQT